MMQTSIQTREAVPADAEALAGLSGQLGYPAESATMARRLRDIAAQHAGVVLVALRSGAVCGFAHAVPQWFVNDAAFVELAALVVDKGARDLGVGRALLAAVEAWARTRGFTRVWVRSNVIRERAHRFYLREGYAEVKRQAVFFKRLGG